ncbi:hypothetical protein AOZ06_14895 [Kibdelosporangium phytohabitans]|uniref:TIGR04222 domain-containing membrane protein n=1 Tax=Kibdelosporangium phytohabitans TaxID=860235 RepID=A0A0N9HXP4_9PSEU|nr:hypothetical protein AOZ06_14895 [Kibdelosporangium phytohabitans]
MTALELACLTGGPRRVVEAAVAQLVETGQLGAARDGYLQIAGRDGGTNPVERTVLADVARHGRRSITMLTHRLAGSDSVGEVVAGLVRAGYLVDDEAARHRKLISTVPVAAVFAAGVMRWLAGISDVQPVGWLTVSLIGTGLIGYALHRQPISPTTFAGAGAVGTAPASKPVELVAAGGFASHPDLTIRESLLGPPSRGWHSSALGGATAGVAWRSAAGGDCGGGDAGGGGGNGGSGCGSGGCGG